VDRIRNDIIESIGHVIIDRIKTWVHAAPFITRMHDETISEIVMFLNETGHGVEAYPEIYKICSLILTIPIILVLKAH